jgi:hypothetical protein
MFQGGNVRVFITILLFLTSYVNAQEPAPIASCLSYEMNRIDKKMGELVLRNVFATQLFENLDKKFPEVEIEWSAWATSVNEYNGEDGKNKTKLEGCFDISEIHNDSELVSSIMKVSMSRFQAAMKFYSKPSSEHIPQEKVDLMLDGYEDLLKDEKVKKAIKDELEHNRQG